MTSEITLSYQGWSSNSGRWRSAVGDALGTGGGGLEGGLPLVQRAIVALVPQVVGQVLVLLVMPTAGEGVAGDGRLRG